MDPFLDEIQAYGYHATQAHQEAVIDKAAKTVDLLLEACRGKSKDGAGAGAKAAAAESKQGSTGGAGAAGAGASR